MKKYEEETGKKAIWRKEITESFKRWKKGEKSYNLNKERIALYVPEDLKKEWIDFAKQNNFPTLSKLIRDSLKFYIEYKLNVADMDKNIEIDLLSHLSHDLKEPLTMIKGYSQLILENYEELSEKKMKEMINKIFNQSLELQTFIIEKIDKSRKIEEKEMSNEKVNPDILIIEDNLETVNFLSNYFELKGYSSVTAISGKKGLEKLAICTPKVILLDIILPDMSGYDVIKEIRDNKSFIDIPIIFLTAIPRVDVNEKMEELGATGIISKPFSLADFDILSEYVD